ncbi:MAG: hypothetical protein ABSD48_10755 [Armatimonadota bacterium]
MVRICTSKSNSGRAARIIVVAAAICWLTGQGVSAWALSIPVSDQNGLALTLDGAARASPLDDSSRPSAGGPLQFSFGTPDGLKADAVASLGRGRQGPFGGPDAFGLSGITPSWSGAREAERSPQDQASYCRVASTTRPVQLQAKLLDVGAHFLAPDEGLEQMEPDDAKTIGDAAGTRNLNLNAPWKLSPIASFTAKYDTLSNDRLGDKDRGLTTHDTSHTLALALNPVTSLQASLNEHDETWDPELGKADLQRHSSALELKTRLASAAGNDLRMALTTTQTKEGQGEKSESVREIHVNLAPTARLKFAADSVAKSTGQGRDQTDDSFGTTVQLATGAQVAAVVRSLSAEDGTRTRETDLKLDAALGHGATSAQLVAEQKVARSTDRSQSKEVLNVDLAGGVGSGHGRTNIRAALLQERASGLSPRMNRTATLHADRSLGKRIKLVADREANLAGSDQQVTTARIRSAYQVLAELSARNRLTTQLNSEKGGGQPDRMSQNLVFEHQAATYRLRAAQQTWRNGAVDRSAANCSVDVPKGTIPDWAKDITHGHQFADARDYMMPREPNWLDMPFSGFRVYSEHFSGGPDSGARSVGWAHRAMVAENLQVQIACQGRPEGEDGDMKGRPMPLRRKLVEVGTLVGGRLVAQTRYTGDESVGGSTGTRHDIGFGLRGPLSQQEQLEAMVSREAGDGPDNATGRTSVTLMYALKADGDHEVSVKTGCAWTTDSAGVQKAEYRWSLGYSKPI